MLNSAALINEVLLARSSTSATSIGKLLSTWLGEFFYTVTNSFLNRFITTPLLLLDLLLTAGLPWPTILFVILIDWVMIVTGLVGALVSSSYKWGYFAFGCAALAWIVYVLVFEARQAANGIGKDVGRTFLICGSLTTILWCLYPIAWGVCEGGNIISADGEAGFYGMITLRLVFLFVGPWLTFS